MSTDQDEFDEREMPDPSDMDPDDDQTLMSRCPYCKRMIDSESERCPLCGSFISAEDQPARYSVFVLVVLALSGLMLIWSLLHAI